MEKKIKIREKRKRQCIFCNLKCSICLLWRQAYALLGKIAHENLVYSIDHAPCKSVV